MNNNVYLKNTKLSRYENSIIFNPSSRYKEGLNINIESDEKIYNEFRNLLIDMKLDSKNIGTKEWNPFKDFIKPGNNVLIKPNLVKHENACDDGDTDSLITNFSLIRPVIDYTILALKKTGKIIVGDAPVQECNFEEVIKINNLKNSIEKYQKKGYNIELIDFRKNSNTSLECVEVSLNQDSSLVEVDKYADKYAITNYNLKYMHEHHHDGVHQYLIPQDVLNADVIINMPKPKTHRKAGITACMKNFVGINAKKEYLPHHRNGSIHNHGDEYPENSILKNLQSKVKNYTYLHNRIISFLNSSLHYLAKKTSKKKYFEGSWYGNDTIWRTILDINKIILYADKNGKLTNKKQRIIFNVADMIVSGEKEGPLIPSNKKVGLILASFNQLNMDKIICQVMGFNPSKIKYIENGYKLSKYTIANKNEFNLYSESKIVDVNKYNKHFIPTDGWKDYLIEEENK